MQLLFVEFSNLYKFEDTKHWETENVRNFVQS